MLNENRIVIMMMMDTVNVQKFRTVVACHKKHRQTGQTQIRLLLKKQSDQGLPCLDSGKHLVSSSPEKQYFIQEQDKKKVQNFRKFTRPLVKNAYQKNKFLISQPKHMLLVHKRTVSMRRFFRASKIYAKNYG